MTRAIALLVFEHSLDPDTVEGMAVSRLSHYLKIGGDLRRLREEQRSAR